METQKALKIAKDLMDDFCQRTGLSEAGRNKTDRYLWTDAFAVQTLFGLSESLRDPGYKEKAFKLIYLVHWHLGRHHPQDQRTGWISGLSEEEGEKRPTSGGLRIGKEMPERKEDQPHHTQLEWERDGQYFHYITRWISALLEAGRQSGNKIYTLWAADLLLASSKFIYKDGNSLRMYWKMSTDLSRPLVSSMGAHDPLEGLICIYSIQDALPERASEFDNLRREFEQLCTDQNWATSDSLGIGGLLLNAARAAGLEDEGVQLPSSVNSGKLLKESLDSLKRFKRVFIPQQSARQRLAFRECGLSLGLHSAVKLQKIKPEFQELEQFSGIAEKIEEFWSDPENRKTATWSDHLNINAVSLAASLIALETASVFA